jgi:nicotinate-nucleotide--dimethylbenzimidazole phosphoribosyltransferase
MEARKETLKETCKSILPLKKEFFEKAWSRLDSLTKPPGSLGRLEEIAARLVAITEDISPRIDKKVIFTCAGDHGVAAQGVSAYPKEVTMQMVFNFLRGGAAINVLGRHAGAEVAVVDAGVDWKFDDAEGLINKKIVMGTRDMSKGPAMTEKEATDCMEAGIQLVRQYKSRNYNLFGTGDMGIGNTTPSSAIASVLTGFPPSAVTGRGTGINDGSLARKIKVVEEAISVNKPDASDAIDVLAKVGGAEIGVIAGICLGGAAARVPIVVDGFISTAGALIAYALEPACAEYMFSAHRSQEPGHAAMLEKMGLRPILDLDMRLGEGTGSALAMLVIEAALKIFREMATFGEAGVSDEKV